MTFNSINPSRLFGTHLRAQACSPSPSPPSLLFFSLLRLLPPLSRFSLKNRGRRHCRLRRSTPPSGRSSDMQGRHPHLLTLLFNLLPADCTLELGFLRIEDDAVGTLSPIPASSKHPGQSTTSFWDFFFF